jgi:hypothetical protein
MNRQAIWRALLALSILGMLAGGGYALYRAGHAQGYKKGLAENVDDEKLAACIEKRCGFESWGCGPGWGAFPSRQSFGPGRGSPPPPAVCLAFLGGMLLLLLLVLRAAMVRLSRASGGGGWQLSFGPRPPVDSPPPGSENTSPGE